MFNVVVLVTRVEDVPEPYAPSETRQCMECGEEVWVSKVYLKAIEEASYMCTKCFLSTTSTEDN